VRGSLLGDCGDDASAAELCWDVYTTVFPAGLDCGALSWRCLGGISRGGVSQNS
jgi:hypothetical protein